MATIAVLLDVEEGHFLATFQLSRDLRARGHRVCYLGLADAEGLVRQQGFDFLPLAAVALPADRARIGEDGSDADWFDPLVRGELLDHAMSELAPDLMLILSLYYPEALVIRCRYGVPVVMLNTLGWIRSRAETCELEINTRLLALKSKTWEVLLQLLSTARIQFRSLKDLAQIALRLPELVFLPEAYAAPGAVDDPQTVHIGAGVDLERAEAPLAEEGIEPGRPLVYCSLGSQSGLAGDVARRFFRVALEAAGGADWQMILALGKSFAIDDFTPFPANVRVYNWMPQLAILRRADLMITHSGLGTVKECILMGVPMIALPMMRDQFDSAERLVQHGLGVTADIATVDAPALNRLVREVAGDPSYRQRLALMRQEFQRTNRTALGIEAIEKILQPVR